MCAEDGEKEKFSVIYFPKIRIVACAEGERERVINETKRKSIDKSKKCRTFCSECTRRYNTNASKEHKQ